jgi:hypothetical protein
MRVNQNKLGRRIKNQPVTKSQLVTQKPDSKPESGNRSVVGKYSKVKKNTKRGKRVKKFFSFFFSFSF